MSTEESKAPEAGETMEVSEFGSLLQKEFRPKSDAAKSAVEEAVQTLAAQALESASLISKDALKSIDAIRRRVRLEFTADVF